MKTQLVILQKMMTRIVMRSSNIIPQKQLEQISPTSRRYKATDYPNNHIIQSNLLEAFNNVTYDNPPPNDHPPNHQRSQLTSPTILSYSHMMRWMPINSILHGWIAISFRRHEKIIIFSTLHVWITIKSRLHLTVVSLTFINSIHPS